MAMRFRPDDAPTGQDPTITPQKRAVFHQSCGTKSARVMDAMPTSRSQSGQLPRTQFAQRRFVSAHSFGTYITNRLSRPGMLAESSAPQLARMPILRQWLRLRDENRAKKIPLVLGIEVHREDRQPVASE